MPELGGDEAVNEAMAFGRSIELFILKGDQKGRFLTRPAPVHQDAPFPRARPHRVRNPERTIRVREGAERGRTKLVPFFNTRNWNVGGAGLCLKPRHWIDSWLVWSAAPSAWPSLRLAIAMRPST